MAFTQIYVNRPVTGRLARFWEINARARPGVERSRSSETHTCAEGLGPSCPLTRWL